MTRKSKVSFNSPVVLSFVFISFIALILNFTTKDFSNRLLFSVYRSSPLSPFTYIRLFGHVLGHADMSHFLGNMMILLIIGPLLEEKYGSFNLLFVMVATALITGLVHIVLFPYTRLLGASGIVFAFILLSSFTNVNDNDKGIPFTFILVALLYIGQEVYSALAIKDNISNLTHIIGGFIGGWLGYIMNRYNIKRY